MSLNSDEILQIMSALLGMVGKPSLPFDVKFSHKGDYQTSCYFSSINLFSLSANLTCQVPIWVILLPHE